jgi:hypothetical protein
MPSALRAGGFFAAGAAVVGASTAAAKIVLGHFDPKYRHAPLLALQLELAGIAVLVTVGSILLILTLRVRRRSDEHLGWLGALVAGAAYPPVWHLLHGLTRDWTEPESAVLSLASGTVLVAYPIAAALLLAHPRWQRGNRSAQVE